jgi:hypothetical protein
MINQLQYTPVNSRNPDTVSNSVAPATILSSTYHKTSEFDNVSFESFPSTLQRLCGLLRVAICLSDFLYGIEANLVGSIHLSVSLLRQTAHF